MRRERGKLGSSTRGHSQRKRESRGVDWAVASAASHQLSVIRGHAGTARRQRSNVATKAHGFGRTRGWPSLPTSTSAVTSPLSSEATLYLDDSAERRKKAFWQDVPQQLFRAKSPQRQGNLCRPGAAAKQRTVVILRLDGSLLPLSSVSEP
ncbi:hypothetical protein CGC20_31580 [Leishmania donovani]|uniref:Uncharacterized protein n=1 Tax=Leishmania donovani TaxID=5661 RepID=A0A504XE30_LEIDO|nr:hypothetical protein CGC20_31580 [Leishmania donovani]TPP49901.1 hypothetical protein CGC21_29335 [Leishmania donovani]